MIASTSLVGSLSATPAAAYQDRIGELIAGRTADAPELAGVALVVADRKRVRRAAAWGRAVIDAADPARERGLTVDTPVRIASVSKVAVVIVVMRLVEAGRLDLDHDVSGWLGWRLRNPAFPDSPLTLRQLLSHTSGLDDASGYSFPLGIKLQGALTPDHWSAAPGARFSYANINFGVIATVLEAATGMRFDRLMTQQLFAPLGMNACFNWSGCTAGTAAQAAVLYRKGIDETAWQPGGPWVAQIDAAPLPCPVRAPSGCDLGGYRPGDNGTLFSPQGGMRITMSDLAKLGQLLLRGGEIGGVRLLQPASVDAMLTPVWLGGPSGETYAGLMQCYGLSMQCLVGGRDRLIRDRPARLWGHLGEAYGLYSGLWIDRERRRVYAYAITGVGDDPHHYPAAGTAFTAIEQAVATEAAR